MELFTNARAIRIMSSSVPVNLSKFTPKRINRQLSVTYPFAGSMRSILGEKIDRPGETRSKSIPVSLHLPFQLSSHQASVRLNGSCFLMQRCLAPVSRGSHGCFAFS